MNEKNADSEMKSLKTPWHLWVIGVVGILWNSMGVMDFVMTLSKNQDYMKAFTPEQIEFFYSFPGWLVVFWAIGVFGGLVGSLLLLFRSKLAVPVFGASLIAMVTTAIHNYGFDKMYEMTGMGAAIFTAVIFVIALLLVIYSMAMQKRAVLR